MSLFFDAGWFDARLAERGLARGDLAVAAGLDDSGLAALIANQRPATGAELSAFAGLLGVDLVQVSLRAGVSARPSEQPGDPGARIDSIEARLDEIDTLLAELEAGKKRA